MAPGSNIYTNYTYVHTHIHVHTRSVKLFLPVSLRTFISLMYLDSEIYIHDYRRSIMHPQTLIVLGFRAIF